MFALVQIGKAREVLLPKIIDLPFRNIHITDSLIHSHHVNSHTSCQDIEFLSTGASLFIQPPHTALSSRRRRLAAEMEFDRVNGPKDYHHR
jgi:hypothetical protein